VLAMMPAAILIAAAADHGVALPHSAVWIIPVALLAVILHGLALLIACSDLGLTTIFLATDLAVTIMIVFCPIFYAADEVPAALIPIVRYAPPTLAVDAVMAFWRGAVGGWWPTCLLGCWAAGFLAVGYRRIRIG
jgi:hypothetical protein